MKEAVRKVESAASYILSSMGISMLTSLTLPGVAITVSMICSPRTAVIWYFQ